MVTYALGHLIILGQVLGSHLWLNVGLKLATSADWYTFEALNRITMVLPYSCSYNSDLFSVSPDSFATVCNV
jgi:hypothetical protein